MIEVIGCFEGVVEGELAVPGLNTRWILSPFSASSDGA